MALSEHERYRFEKPIKATYVKATNTWKVYWLRADLKWHRYEPKATVSSVEGFIAEIDRDPYGCFFG